MEVVGSHQVFIRGGIRGFTQWGQCLRGAFPLRLLDVLFFSVMLVMP